MTKDRIHRKVTSEYIKNAPNPGVYRRYPDISDRKAWGSLSSTLKSGLITAGEEAAAEPWKQLLISDYTLFSRNGDRAAFEEKYFSRRRKLNSQVMAECIENKGRFIPDILDGLYLILDETTWCLPAHNSYIRDSKQEYLPDVTRPIIDLFQAESGAEVALAEYLLRPVLSKISPFISGYVNERLRERIFEPYFNSHFWWMGNGEEPMCNWTVWCTQNVLLAALTREEEYFSREKRLELIKKAAASCDFFLDEYGDDGCCNEGAGYYSHAGLCLFGCYEIMEGALGADSGFASIYNEPLVHNIASYIVKMYAGGNYYINFADCSALPGRRTAREFLFGKATGDAALMSFAASDFRNESIKEQLLPEEINLFYHVLQAFTYEDIMNYKASDRLPEDSWFESVGLMVARDEHFVLAAKAGNNGDSHNHNDVGSFTIYRDGRPFIIDLGVGTYTQKTFSDKRYEIWTMQSQFHNLPTFLQLPYINDCKNSFEINSKKPVTGSFQAKNEHNESFSYLYKLGLDSAADSHNPDISMQHDGAEYAASDVKCILCRNDVGADSDKYISSLSMNIAGAYGDGRIRSYHRTVSLFKGQSVVVEDNYDGDLKAVVSLMTYEKPKLFGCDCNKAGDSELIDLNNAETSSAESCIHISVGDIGYISISGAENVQIQSYPIEDERLKTAWKHEVYRILLTLGQEKRIRMEFQ